MPVAKSLHDRDPVGERDREQRRRRHHHDEDDGQRDGEAAQVAPPGRGPPAHGGGRRRWRWRRRRRTAAAGAASPRGSYRCARMAWRRPGGLAAPCARLDACRPRSCSGSTSTTRSSRPGCAPGAPGCVIACPHDVLGYRDDEGVYKPFQLEDGCGPGRLQPRREGLHVVHPGLPPVPGVGARDRRVPVRPGPHRRRGRRASTRTSSSPGPPTRCSHEVGQDGGLVSAHPRCTALENDIIDAALVSYLEGDGTTWKAIPGRRPHQGGHHRLGRQPLHLLGEHHGLRRRHRGRRRAHRARGHELPVVGAAGDEAAQGGQGRAAALAQHRAAVLQDVRRRHLRGALRGEVRPEEGRHEEDEHQGRLPDLDEQRRLPRGAAQGVPRVDA